MKETLEEAAKEYLFEVYQKQFIVETNDIQHGVLKGFIEGAKYMQEQMYSEEDLHKAYCAGSGYNIECLEFNQQYYMFKEWFEQLNKQII